MAGFNDVGRFVLSAHSRFPKRGAVRTDFANQAIRGFHSSEYCRRVRAGEHQGFYSLSTNCPRLSKGAGDSFAVGGASKDNRNDRYRSSNCAMRVHWKNAQNVYPILTAERVLIATHYSLLTTHHSPLTTHY